MKRILTIFAVLCLGVNASAQSVPSLLIPTDSRALGMGGVSYLPGNNKVDASAFFGIWAPGTASNTIVGADVRFRLGSKLSFCLGGKDFIDKPYEIINDKGASVGAYKPYDMVFSLGAGYDITDAITAGAILHTVSSSIAEKANGGAFFADVYGAYKGNGWTAALALRNLGTKINYGGEDNALPALVALNGSWSPVSGLKIAAEADYLFNEALMAGAGAEYCIANIVFVRAGYHYGDAQKALASFASLGLGAQFAGIRLDASWLFASKNLGDSILVTLGYAF